MRFGAVPLAVTASLLAHSAFFYSTNQIFQEHEKKIALIARQKARNELLNIQFIESPAKKYPGTPKKTGRVSNHDALNQDLIPKKSAPDAAPQIKNTGLSDQLEQKKFKPSSMPAPARRPVPPSQNQPQEAPKEENAPKPNPNGISLKQMPPTPPPPPQAQPQPSQTPQTASTPQPKIEGLTGRDKITTQEMARKSSVGAQLFGITSFEATGSGMGAYMKNLKDKVWFSWFPYLAFKYPQDFKGADVVLSFTLNKKGELKIIRVEDFAGSPTFADFCMEAVQRAAAGFGPLPPEILDLLGKEDLEIKFGFHYR